MPRIDIDALEDEWEEEVGRRGRPPRREVVYSREAREKIEQHDVARVVGVDRGHVDVLYDGHVATARYAGSMRGTKVVVGDRVRVKPPRHETDAPRVLARIDPAAFGDGALARFVAMAAAVEATPGARLPGRRRHAIATERIANGLVVDDDLVAAIEAI